MSHNTLTPAEQEVWQVIVAFNQAFAVNDAERFFSFMHDDVILISPSNPYRVSGKKIDREEFEFSLREGNTRVGYFQALQPHIWVFGDTAIVIYYSRGQYGSGDNARTAYLKETDVLVKQDGEWKIIHIHLSATQGG
jgi:uncharacterized protein (TIGR02246 family)